MEEQRLFRSLAVFAGGCTLEAVEAIGRVQDDSELDVIDQLASLIDKHLLQPNSAQKESTPRLLMLETIREYALECLERQGEMERVQRAHAAYYISFVEAAKAKLRTGEQLHWLGRLDDEYDNIRAVLQWSVERGRRGDCRACGGGPGVFVEATSVEFRINQHLCEIK